MVYESHGYGIPVQLLPWGSVGGLVCGQCWSCLTVCVVRCTCMYTSSAYREMYTCTHTSIFWYTYIDFLVDVVRCCFYMFLSPIEGIS